jgi:hypothetical protein
LPPHAAERTDWSGFDLGVNAGAGWGESKFRSKNDVPLFPSFIVGGDAIVGSSNG